MVIGALSARTTLRMETRLDTALSRDIRNVESAVIGQSGPGTDGGKLVSVDGYFGCLFRVLVGESQQTGRVNGFLGIDRQLPVQVLVLLLQGKRE